MRKRVRNGVPGVEQVIDLAVRIFGVRSLCSLTEFGNEALVLMGEKSLQ